MWLVHARVVEAPNELNSWRAIEERSYTMCHLAEADAAPAAIPFDHESVVVVVVVVVV